jgi:hypothetical protein
MAARETAWKCWLKTSASNELEALIGLYDGRYRNFSFGKYWIWKMGSLQSVTGLT